MLPKDDGKTFFVPSRRGLKGENGTQEPWVSLPSLSSYKRSFSLALATQVVGNEVCVCGGGVNVLLLCEERKMRERNIATKTSAAVVFQTWNRLITSVCFLSFF